MTRLFVAEKPSVARDLAAILGARQRGDAWIDGEGVRVTWCIGHLVEIATPEDHDPRWKRWDPALLPILPQTLLLQPAKKTAAHLKTLTRLLRDPHVTEIVNACDAGREGELIFRYVYDFAGATKPVRRFWISSLTPQAIRAGLAKLRPGVDYDALAAAARCRAEADWLVGMNGTRGLTARADGLLSVGRVQTPTLAMVVTREDAIEAFEPEPYWEVEATLAAAAGRWTARYIGPADAPPADAPRDDAPPGPDGQRPEDRRGRLPTADAAAALAARLRGADARVTLAERDRQTVPPPLLHHLTSLQREANRRHRFTAARTLRAAQTLYEQHKLITYPRTDSRHLTHDVAAGLPAVVIAIAVGPWAQHARRILQGPPPAIGKRIVDDTQVTDHHAIIPTAVAPDLDKLGPDERAIYELIARRLLAALSPPALYARTRLIAEAAGALLEARGRVRLEPGWEAVEPPQRIEAKDKTPDDPELPPVEVGDAARVEDSRALAKQTRPPPRYTEASLLGAMERAGRDLDDAALRAAMRDGGLGTPATRAAIVETLVRRGYLARDGRVMQPTPAGRALITALPVDTLKSPRLTAEWERRLGLIAAGEADPSVFRRDIRRFVTDLVAALAHAPRVTVPVEQAPRRARRAQSGPRAPRRGRGNAAKTARRSTRAADPAATPVAAKSARRAPRAAAPDPARPARRTTRAADPADRARRSTRAADPSATPPADRARRAATTRAAASPPERAAWPAPTPDPAARHRDAPRREPLPEPHRPHAPAPPETPAPPRCPACGEGHIITGNRGWGCDRWRAGCRFVVWFEHEGIRIPEAEAERLFRFGRTRPFARLPDTPFPLGLVLDRHAPGNVRWERFGAG